jgi:hypothetical protein
MIHELKKYLKEQKLIAEINNEKVSCYTVILRKIEELENSANTPVIKSVVSAKIQKAIDYLKDDFSKEDLKILSEQLTTVL